MGQVPCERMERASRVSGRASVLEQCLSRVAGSRSGPVALVVSSELRSRRVCRVRRSTKLLVSVGGALSFWFSSLSLSVSCVGFLGIEGSVNFVENVSAKRSAFVVASCTHVPSCFISSGIERRGGSLLRSCRLMRYHCLSSVEVASVEF